MKFHPSFTEDEQENLLEPHTPYIRDVDDLSAYVKEIRKDKNNPFRDMLPKEDVIHYIRDLTMLPLTKHTLQRDSFPRENNFTLVTRIRLDDFLKEMDDPNDVVFRRIQCR
jgi:hypothetical protein